ncbi:MAG TPA: hypothetical protein GXZ95_00285 [Mollicutes bacterium]|nr:hypothetical protein [Mollicutes bacterium]
MIQFMDEKDRPKDWPATYSEARLSEVFNYIKIFKDNPTFENKEVLLSLVNQTDLNEGDTRGIHRITEYEVTLINSIYLESLLLQAHDIKIYLYRHISKKIFTNKWASISLNKENYGINNEYQNLIMQLKIFALTYHYFITDKDKSYVYKIKDVTNNILKNENKEQVMDYIHHLNIMIYDLSYSNSSLLFEFLNFSREELLVLFEMQSNLLKKYEVNPIKRPLFGLLNLTLTNWILRSRNNYNTSFLYKCISTASTKKISKNNEVWMQRIQLLNDKREGKVVKELFKNKQWLKHDWVKSVDLDLDRTSFVSSFCRDKPNDIMMKKYGKNIYGYKNDIIRSHLSPIYKLRDKHVTFGHVINYDIIYSRDEFKEEINFLCDVINLYEISESDKNHFLNSIIKYWLLSIKDEKWSYEKERRYEIFANEDISYIESVIDDSFLKVKSFLFTIPDFIVPGSSNYHIIKNNRKNKLNALSTKSFVFCNDCLFSDFDYGVKFLKEEYLCKNCNSNRVEFINKEPLLKS